MKLTLITPAFAAILGLALVSVPVTTQAQTPAPVATTAPAPASSAPAKPAKAKKTEYKGTLSAIDTATNTITLAGTPPRTLAITSATKIKKDKKPATLADFTVGVKVTGSYTTDATGKLVAASLYTKTVVASAKPATKPAGTTAPAATTPASAPAGQ